MGGNHLNAAAVQRIEYSIKMARAIARTSVNDQHRRPFTMNQLRQRVIIHLPIFPVLPIIPIYRSNLPTFYRNFIYEVY